jgi:hypothetical protein
LKKCMPTTSVGRLVTDAQAMIGSDGSGRSQDGAGLADLVEVLEQRTLVVEVLRDRLDDDVDVGEVFQPRCVQDSPERSRQRVLLQLAPLHRLEHRPGHALADLVGAGLGACDRDHVVAGAGEDLDNADAHCPGADDAHSGDVAAQRMRCRHGGRRLGVVDDSWRVGRFVGVEAAPGLTAEQTGSDHLLQDRRRSVQTVATLPGNRVQDLVRRIKPMRVEAAPAGPIG